MMYRIGDEVVLKIQDTFGYTDTTYRSAKVQVIGYDTDDSSTYTQYLCYVPPYETVPKSFVINRTHIKLLNVDPKFLGDTGCFITMFTETYKHIPAKDGALCARCDEFCEGAQHTDDEPYFCRACRENPYR